MLHTTSVQHYNSNLSLKVENTWPWASVSWTSASAKWSRVSSLPSGRAGQVASEGFTTWYKQRPPKPKPDTTGTLASYSKPLRHQSLVGIIHGQLISLLPVSTKWFPNLKSSITACTDSCLTLFFVEISRNWKGLFFRFSLQLKAIFQPGLLSQMGE